MIRLWIISCKLNPSHKINALNSPQFHPPTPPPKSELPGNGNVSLETFLLTTGFKLEALVGAGKCRKWKERRRGGISFLLSVLTSNSKQWLSHLFSSFHSVGNPLCGLKDSGNNTPSLYPSSLSCSSGFVQVLMSGLPLPSGFSPILTSL